MSESSFGQERLPEWEQAAEAVLARPGVVVLLGASDSGKTTLSRILAEHWRTTGRTVGLVDGDIGQSSIGPPTTVGLAILSPNHPITVTPVPRLLYFVGSTSPPGRFLPHILGTQALVHAAIAGGAEIVLVDTTGLIVGAAAASVKWHKLQAIRPQHVLALQREEELEPILRLVDGRSGLEIHRLPVSSRVIRRSQAARRAFREERFREYFGRASRRDLEWKGLRFIRLWLNTGRRLAREELTALGVSLQTLPVYAEAAGEEGLVFVRGSFNRAALYQVRNALQVSDVLVIDVEQLRGTLLGLHDPDGEFLALAILLDFDLEQEKLRVLSPVPDPARARSVAFGSLRLDPSGKELCEAPWRLTP
jgi:polynucleotide 5'-hydroxyl-kinase GRC3/NOL9